MLINYYVIKNVLYNFQQTIYISGYKNIWKYGNIKKLYILTIGGLL